MADTKTPVIKIQTLEAVRSVADLKNNIKALKQALDDVNTSTDDYADITKQLQQNQAALRNVMNGTNSTFQESITAARGLDSSYNSLVEQLKEATQEWRAIPKYLTEVDAQQNKVNEAWTAASAKVLDLRSQLKAMDEGTGSYVRNVGNYKSALDGFSGAMGTVKQVGGDMVNGLSAAASTLSLMGIQADGLNDSMKNMRIVLAAVQGAKGFAGLIKNLASYFKAGKSAVAVTQQQAVALEGEAAAQTAANTATAAGTTALGGLQKALIATGIGAIVVGLGMVVAHFEDIVKWLGKVGEKLGIVSKQSKVWENANDNLGKKFTEQNRQLELQQKIYAAQGKSKTTLLKQQKTQIELQIAETQATIKTIEARVKEMEADSAWVRFWKGENAQIRKAKEEIEALTESLKEMNNTKDSINVDIQVEEIEAGNKAAENANKAVEAARKILDKQLEAAKKLKSELEQIRQENKQNVSDLKDALDVIDKITGVTAQQKEEWKKLLNEGLANEATRYAKVLSDYYKKEYEKKTAEEAEKITREKNAQYMEAERIERAEMKILGLSEQNEKMILNASVARRKEYEILKKQVEIVKNDIEPELFNEYVESGKIFSMTDKQISEMFVEPTATAIRTYISKTNELQAVGEEMQKEILEGYENAINDALSSGNFALAESLWSGLHNQVWKMFGDEDVFGIGGKAAEYLSKMDDLIKEAQLHYIPDGGLLGAILYGPDRNLHLKGELEEVKAQIRELGEITEENNQAFLVLNEKAAKLSMKIWDNYWLNIGKHLESYGNAVSNLMGSVADAWEAALQAQVKAGKKSEEEAKKSFEGVKALQIGVAVINTAAAVTSALADPTIPSYFVKAVNAAAALAAGTAQVIKISSTEFSANAAAATQNTPTLVDRSPELQYTVALNTEDYAAAMAEQPIRAYITDRDLDEGMSQYNRRRGETTF